MAMRCWTGVVRSFGMGGRLMSANAPVATRTGSHLASVKRGAMIKATRTTQRQIPAKYPRSITIKIFSVMPAIYLLRTDRICQTNALHVAYTIIPTCICKPVQVGRPAYPKYLQLWCYHLANHRQATSWINNWRRENNWMTTGKLLRKTHTTTG